MRVFKFYGVESAKLNLEGGRLKISTIDDLNDPFEFMGPALVQSTDRTAWRQMRYKLFSDKGIICFSKVWSDPVIWSHYADSHKGLALGFDVDDNLLKEVQYDIDRESVSDLKQLSPSQRSTLLENSLHTKYRRWEYENEVRAFVKLEEKDPDNGLYFKDFGNDLKLKEVIIGANSPYTSSDILRLLGNVETPKITTARLAFRRFEVCKQKNVKLQR